MYKIKGVKKLRFNTYQQAYQFLRKSLRREFPADMVGRVNGQPPISPLDVGYKIVRI
jgi:hypothetical protein